MLSSFAQSTLAAGCRVHRNKNRNKNTRKRTRKIPVSSTVASILASTLTSVVFGRPRLSAISLGVLFACIGTPNANAANSTLAASPKLATALQTAHEQQLAHQVAWRRLLYYPELKKPVFNVYKAKDKKNDTSRIINRFNPVENQQRFFIHANGSTDATAELNAMLTAMFDPNTLGDAAAQCRFPARSAWLKQQLQLTDSDLPTVHCSAYQAWRRKMNPQSASVIFTTEYLDSLSSAFAHSFLRFDNDTDPYYLNYTPKVTEGESQLKFAYKSAIAGNAGEFSITNYAQGIREYKQDQGRDVWQYKLKLTDSQLEQLARQVYEIKDQLLPYYLLDDNCASEILVLLNTLFPQKDYLKGMTTSVAPAQIMRRLADDGLVAESNFEPATLTEQQAQLNKQNASQLGTGTVATDTATQLVASRNSPLLANPLGQVSVGYADQQANSHQSALRLGYRVVYHDALDKPAGYPIGSQLSALSASLLVRPNAKADQDSVELEQATLLQLRSFNPINTAKAQLHDAAWGINVGLQQAYDGLRDDATSHLVGHAEFEYGKSLAYGQPPMGSGEMPPNLCYALGNVATEVGKGLAKGYRIGVGTKLGCIHQLSDTVRSLAEFGLPYWLGGDSRNERYWQPKLSIGTQYDLNRRDALRLTANREWLNGDKLKTVDNIAVNYLHYFE